MLYTLLAEILHPNRFTMEKTNNIAIDYSKSKLPSERSSMDEHNLKTLVLFSKLS